MILRHVSYYLGPGSRQAYWDGHVELVPNHFSEMPMLLRRTVRPGLVLAAASGPDQHGYFSLGTNADYVASFIGEVPFFLKATDAQPFTYGQNHIHISKVAGWIKTDAPLPAVTKRSPDPRDNGAVADVVVGSRILVTYPVRAPYLPNLWQPMRAGDRGDGIGRIAEHACV